MFLAGDIGGTKTNLAVFSAEKGAHEPVAEATFVSANYQDLETMIQEFLVAAHAQIEIAAFGVAGPIQGNRVQMTNLTWSIDADRVRDAFSLKAVYLLNDLQSIASAVPILQPSDVYTLNNGTPKPGGSIGVIAPGTGLGEAFLAWDGQRYHAYASEGGHSSFAPLNTTELDMLRYLLERYDHISYERVGSGLGLPNIYAFFRDTQDIAELPHITEQLAQASDPTPIIVNAALDATNPSPLCQQTLNTFISVLGSEAGNLALTLLATGGIYLGGGIPPRILSSLTDGHFMQAFLAKGRFDQLLTHIPVYVILNPKAALLGAAHVAMSGGC